RFWWMAAAVIAAFFALLSPVDMLAQGYLFSAHMIQHTLLLLVVPALLIFALPPGLRLPRPLAAVLKHPFACWMAGMGSMYLWHIPALCDAAAVYRPVFAIETVSLLALGMAFWWPILAPAERSRLSPPGAIIYLFGTCMACSALGIIVTFSPVSVCPVFVNPTDKLGLLHTIRGDWGITSDKDQKIGGLMMWVPLCFVYLGAIFWQIARWFAPGPETQMPITGETHR
ncbi:MAG TPA: cytochrome c oxidase assembly protein, partial [Chthoniobacteraceae bacterium]|nr:cytochrome c oxidase assembly protein [Chthoniobacteraceae bacterium]